MPKKKSPNPKPLYKSPPPKPKGRAVLPRRPNVTADQQVSPTGKEIGHPLPASHFELREDGSIAAGDEQIGDSSSEFGKSPSPNSHLPSASLPRLIHSDASRGVWLYHGNCLELLDAIAAKYPEGRFDAIFADPPYFLSNGGITCHAGKMVKVDKGDWDISRGPELNHEFNLEWLARCQRVLKPNGTLWVSGTHHVIFSIGYALQQLGYKILNDIAWEKPNPPPNLSCRYFTHSTETILWAAKNDQSKHVFNYQEMRKVTGKQMKTVWRREEFETRINTNEHELKPASEAEKEIGDNSCQLVSSVWTLGAPGNDEKTFGKHPTQKPVALIERCLLASTNENDLVLDPFLGNGTTAVAAIRLKRQCVGIELDLHNVQMAEKRVNWQIIEIWLRHFRVRVEIVVESSLWLEESARSADATQIDLAIFPDSINGSRVDDKPQVPTERIYHECKFVFLSCAQMERGAVVHTTVDVSLQEAWAKTPNGKKRETTHIVRCETEIFRIKSV